MKKIITITVSLIVTLVCLNPNTIKAEQTSYTKNTPKDVKVSYVDGTGIVVSSNDTNYLNALISNRTLTNYPIVISNDSYTYQVNSNRISWKDDVPCVYGNKYAAIIPDKDVTELGLFNGKYQIIFKANNYYNLISSFNINRSNADVTITLSDEENNAYKSLSIQSNNSDIITQILNNPNRSVGYLNFGQDICYFEVASTDKVDANQIKITLSNKSVPSGDVSFYLTLDGYQTKFKRGIVKGIDAEMGAYPLTMTMDNGNVVIKLANTSDAAARAWLTSVYNNGGSNIGIYNYSGNDYKTKSYREFYNFPVTIRINPSMLREKVKSIKDNDDIIGFILDKDDTLRYESIPTGTASVFFTCSGYVYHFEPVTLTHPVESVNNINLKIKYDNTNGSLTIESKKDYIDNLNVGNCYLDYYSHNGTSNSISLFNAVAPKYDTEVGYNQNYYKHYLGNGNTKIVMTKEYLATLNGGNGLVCKGYDFLFRSYKYEMIRTNYKDGGYGEIVITPIAGDTKDMSDSSGKGFGYGNKGKEDLKKEVSGVLQGVCENNGGEVKIGTYQDEYIKSLKSTDTIQAKAETKNADNQQDIQLIDDSIQDKSLVSYFDMKVAVYVNDSPATYKDALGANQELVLTDLNNPIEYGLDVPNNLPEVENGKERVYTVERVHNGVHETIPATVKNGKIYFKSDLYSTYALSYKDQVPTKKTAEDKSCEKVIGLTWRWNDTLGVCEEYSLVRTSSK